MRRYVVSMLALFVVIALSSLALAAPAAVSARGQFKGEGVLLGIPCRIQLAFNVQDTGPELDDDRGTISLRLFHPVTGKLLDVVVSTDVWDVGLWPDGAVRFVARLRVLKADEERTVQFWAYGGASWFQIGSPQFTDPVTILHGKVVVRTP